MRYFILKTFTDDEAETCKRCNMQELIRCKDCKYWVPGVITDRDDFIPPKCGKYSQMVGHSADDFCSLAEQEVTGMPDREKVIKEEEICLRYITLLKEQDKIEEQLIEAFNTIRNAYNSPANREKILLNYLLRIERTVKRDG